MLSNAAWLPPGTDSVPLGPDGIKAGILCRRHNAQLAPLDDVGVAFCDLLLDVFEGTVAAAGPRQLNLPGDDLERWVLKVAAGAMVAGVVRLGGTRRKWAPPDPWVQVIFGCAASSGLGLCFVQKLATPHRGHGLAPLTIPGETGIVGAVFEFMGLWMVVMPDSLTPLGVKEGDAAPEPMTSRPDQINFRNQRGGWTVNLDWRGRGSGFGVTYVQGGR